MKKFLALSTLMVFIGLVLVTSCKKDPEPTPIPDVPELTVTPASLSFGSLDPGATSDALSVAITGEYLKGDVTVTVPADFIASETETGTYSADNIVIAQANVDAGASVSIYFKAVAPNVQEGALAGNAVVSSQDIDDINIALSATVGLTITGQLFMEEYFDVYGVEWQTFLPLDSALLQGWKINTDTIMDWETIPNNQMMSHWYPATPSQLTLRQTLGLSASTTLAITGYPAAPTGARSMLLDPADKSGDFTYIKTIDDTVNPPVINCASKTGGNTGVARRFAADSVVMADGTTKEVYLAALIKVEALANEADADYPGFHDVIMLANTNIGPNNGSSVKILTGSNGAAAGFHFAINKENEASDPVWSTDVYDFSTTYLVVMSHKFVEGVGNDITKLYIFKEGDDIPFDISSLTPQATMDDTYQPGGIPSIDPTDLNQVYSRERRQKMITPLAEITGIRVGDTWVATIFEEAANAVNANSITDRTMVNEGSGACN
ncbi:MAG: hypothetical protein ABFS32_05190 [Bacteroidota bacterium]